MTLLRLAEVAGLDPHVGITVLQSGPIADELLRLVLAGKDREAIVAAFASKKIVDGYRERRLEAGDVALMQQFIRQVRSKLASLDGQMRDVNAKRIELRRVLAEATRS